MRLSDSQKMIRTCVAGLDYEQLLAKLSEYQRAGFPGSSLSDHRGGEPPLPVASTPESDDWESDPKPTGRLPWGLPTSSVLGPADVTDRQIRGAVTEYARLLTNAALALQKARRIEMRWCDPAPTTTSTEKKLDTLPQGAGPCENQWCTHFCSGRDGDRLKVASRRTGDDPHKPVAARCEACYKYWMRNWRERDARLVSTSETDRQPV